MHPPIGEIYEERRRQKVSGYNSNGCRETTGVVFFSLLLIALLVWCNLKYIGHVWYSTVATWRGRDIIKPSHQDAYDINLMTDIKQLWTHCLDAGGEKVCRADEDEKKWETELAVILFFWSICFPFIKVIISLFFWFVPCSEKLRWWVMYIKVHIGRWALIECFMLWTWIYCFKWLIKFDVLGFKADVETCFYLDDWGAVFVCAQLASLLLSHIVMHLVSPRAEEPLRDRLVNDPQIMIPHRPLGTLLLDMFFFIAAAGNLFVLYYVFFIAPIFKFDFEGEAEVIVHQLEHKVELTVFEFVTKSTQYACGNKNLVVATCYFTLLICPLLASISLFWWRVFVLFFPYKQHTTRGWMRATEIITVYNCLDVIILSLQFTDTHFPQLFRVLLIGALGITDMDKWLKAEFPLTLGYKLLFAYAGVHWVTYFFSEWQAKSKERRLDPIYEFAAS